MEHTGLQTKRCLCMSKRLKGWAGRAGALQQACLPNHASRGDLQTSQTPRRPQLLSFPRPHTCSAAVSSVCPSPLAPNAFTL